MNDLISNLLDGIKRDIKKGNKSIVGIKGNRNNFVGAIEFSAHEHMHTFKFLYEYHMNLQSSEAITIWNDNLYRGNIPMSHYTLEIYSKNKTRKKKEFLKQIKALKDVLASLLINWQVSKKIQGHRVYMRRNLNGAEYGFWKCAIESLIIYSPGQVMIDQCEDEEGLPSILIIAIDEQCLQVEEKLEIEIDVHIE